MSTMGNLTYAENAVFHYMYGRAIGNVVLAELCYECITLNFLINEYRITEFFGGYIVNVKHVRFMSPVMILVDERLYTVQAGKKAS
ncbi:hypothetical protein TNCV_2703551 [Trichonephila clavipes]|nr:hypothetical protein TNCV_2703551 [Trichonephila clavipes]